MSRYPRYPRYKESGVEWLGEVPEHWEVMSLSRITESKCDGPFGSGIKSDHYTDTGARVVRLQNIRESGFNGFDSAYLDEHYFESRLKRHEVVEGDVLIAGLGDENNPVGRACVAPAGISPALVKADCFRFRLTDDVRPQYVATQLSVSAKAEAGYLATGSTRSRITLSRMAGRKVAFPESLKEQDEICAFLVRETARIDALIEKKQRLIGLLKEKRQAVITQAVTKGIGPNVPMKDTGVEWLGEVPEHWATVALGYRYEVVLGKMLDQKRVTGEHLSPYLRNVDVQWDRINTTDLPEMDFSGPDVRKYALRKGDLLVCEGGDVGRCAIWNSEAADRTYYQKALHRLRPYEPKKDNPRFLMYVLWNASGQGRFVSGGGKATIAHLTAESLRRYVFAFPDRREQDSIVMHLDQLRGKYEAIIHKTEESVRLLREHRSALITAAVTGQIDVRHSSASCTRGTGTSLYVAHTAE